MYRITIALFVASISFVAPASAAEDWRPMWLATTPLSALNAITIEVEKPLPETRNVGVTTKLLHDTVELALRRNRIRVEEDPRLLKPSLSFLTAEAEVKQDGQR